MTTEQLNAIANLIGTDSKETVFSTAILFLVSEGMNIREAMDAVLGEGTAASVISKVYEAANK